MLSGEVRRFRTALLRWFGKEQRALPWRETKDPYCILVSEIMLQQTRVAVVILRYREFLEKFPDVYALAKAREQSVLALWSGLGYYRRARSLHTAAKIIAEHGSFPATALEMEELPGVGRYTAAAVASIAFGEPAAVVDGNVKRVLRRLFAQDLSDDDCWRLAGQLLEKKQPGDFNQAMMELGALVCLPQEPRCVECPVTAQCGLRGAGVKKQAVSRRKAAAHYTLAHRQGRVLLQQRDPSASLMPGMWELPSRDISAVKEGEDPLLRLRHAITTTDYTVLVFAASRLLDEGRWVDLRSVEKLPLTGLTRKILKALKLLP
jgi:A/G-specific adenine glycosylase